MLLFPTEIIDDDVILANANTLSTFTPSDLSKNNLLEIDSNSGLISLGSRSLISPFADELLSEKGKEISKSQHYLLESAILLWNAKLFLDFIKKRFDDIKTLPKEDIHQFYHHVITLFGFCFLCESYFLKLNQVRKQIESFHGLKKISSDITKDWDRLVSDSIAFGNIINAYRNGLLGEEEGSESEINVPMFGVVLNPRQFKAVDFKIGKFNFLSKHYQASIQFNLKPNSMDEPIVNPFSDKFEVYLSDKNSQRIKGHMLFYPSWDNLSTKVMTFKEFAKAKDSLSAKLINEVNQHKFAALALLNPPHLKVTFRNVAYQNQSQTFLPFFVSMVGIAQQQGFEGVTFYLPHRFSAIALSCGFKSEDSETPSLIEQQAVIVDALSNGSGVPPIKTEFDEASCDEIPLRAFHFKMSEIATTTVTITTEKLTTTYADLLKDNPVIDESIYPKGIVPEINKAPLLLSGASKRVSIAKLVHKRESGQQFHVPSLYLGEASLDYAQLLNTHDGLSSCVLADFSEAKKSKHTKIFVLRRG